MGIPNINVIPGWLYTTARMLWTSSNEETEQGQSSFTSDFLIVTVMVIAELD